MASINDTYPLDLCFKGTREYLHGTDIIPAVLALSGPAKNISFRIHRMTSYPLLAKWVNESGLEKLRLAQQLCVLMVYADERQENKTIAVIEDDKNQITERVPYDESKIIESAYVSGRKIIQNKASTGSFVERVIALNKELINKVVGKHQLVLMRLDLDRMPLSPHAISLELTRVIAGQTFISVIICDGVRRGSIYFSKRL